MIKQVCILTKSYKHGGYCVAGIDLGSKSWVRLVNSSNPDNDEIRKEQMFINGKPIECLDVIECDLVDKISIGCQTENWLLNQNYKWKYIQSLSLEELAKFIKIDNDEFFILNHKNALSFAEASQMHRSLFLFRVENLKVDFSFYEYFDEIHYKYKCSFDYNGSHYSDVSLTDPIYRDPEQSESKIENAFIIASLPSVPYKDELYYKFVAKVIPVEKDLLDYIANPTNQGNDKSTSPFSRPNLVVQTKQTPGTVIFENYEQLKAEISNGASYYKNFEYSLDNFDIAQKHHRELKFVKSILEKTKREIVNAYNQPLNIVIDRIDNLIDIVKEPFKKVDNFIKFNEKEAKRQDIYFYARNIATPYNLQNHIDSILNSPAFFNEKWLLKSCNTYSWKNAVKSLIQTAANDIKNILSFDDDKKTNALAYYYQTLSFERVEQFLSSVKLATNVSEQTTNKIGNEITNEELSHKTNQNFNQDSSIITPKGTQSEVLPTNTQNVENLTDSNILNLVANSINPYTGEVITGIDECLNDRLLHISVKLEIAERKNAIHEKIKNTPRDELHANAGRRWTKSEEEQLIDEFNLNLKISEIAKIHKRKYGGIKARLKSLGLIEDN